MMIDRYSKIVLTVIAAALTIIAARQLFDPAMATDATCGTNSPCMTTIVYWDDISQKWRPCEGANRACFWVGVKQ
jgi:hypothetical protein